MNAQQQNKINTLWEGVLKSVIVSLIKDFGYEALEWLKGKIDEIQENGSVTTQGGGDGPGKCDPGYTWNGTKCIKDPL